MFLQIHTLTSYHASLLNRDDAGLAKRIPFGNATRLRVSSQCLKRHWRETLRNYLDFPRADQTRKFFITIESRLKEEFKLPETLAKTMSSELKAILLSSKSEGEPNESSEASSENYDLGMEQPSIFGRPEQDYLLSLAFNCAKDSTIDNTESIWVSQSEAANKLWVEMTGKEKPKSKSKRTEKEKAKLRENFKAMLAQAGHGHLYAGLEGALFGRFVTSDILSRSDACVHVAHAMTVHPLDTEVDYFTAVEELAELGETGAAHAGDMELGAGLFYGYVAVDVPGLLSNLTGCDRQDWKAQDAHDARQVLQGLVRTIAEVTPGAKLGSTAPYAWADFVLLETGSQQPRSLANAYLQALKPRGDDGMEQAIFALKRYLDAQEQMYGTTAAFRAVAATKTLDWGAVPVLPLAEASDRALAALFE